MGRFDDGGGESTEPLEPEQNKTKQNKTKHFFYIITSLIMTQFVKLKYFYTNINIQANHLYEHINIIKLQITFEPTNQT